MHLEAELYEAVRWAESQGRRWAFSLSNAGAVCTEFRKREAETFLAMHPATRERLERIVRLVEGFETPIGLELLATVHWLISEEHVEASDDLVRAVHDWAPRKRRFTQAQVEIAAARLRSEGWV